MRVLLINPTSDHEIRGPHPLRANDMGVFPHLGLMYIAGVLNQDDEFEVKLMDMNVDQCSLKDLISLIQRFESRIIGLTSYTDCLYDIKLIIEEIRRLSRDIFICLGGPHVEVYPNETLEVFPIDCIIRGDGEYAFRELCRRIRDGQSWHDVGGVGCRESGATKLNQPLQVENLDTLPFPMRELSSMSRIRSTVSRGGAITSICSSRGCPMPCTFCNSPYKKYRLRSPESVTSEIRDCYDRFGIREFYFFDDLFNITKNRLVAVIEAILKLPFRIKWSFRGRIDQLDESLIIKCRNAGCNRIHFGVEAGTDRIQALYRKGLDLKEVQRIFYICRRAGIETVANFIIGAPTETKEEIFETFRFADKLDPTFVEFHVLVPYPYTQIYQEMLSTGIIEKDVWVEYARNPYPGFQPPLCRDTLTPDELYDLLNKAYRRFYFRPRYILKQFVNLENFTDLRKKAWGAFRLLSVTGK